MQPNVLSRLNKLSIHDYLEATPLIIECLEQGIYQWTNPLFLSHLKSAISTWSASDETFMRAVIYSRHLAVVMPGDVDNDIKGYFQRLGSGVSGIEDYPISSPWPRPLNPIWDGKMFWAGREIWRARSDATIFNLVYGSRLKRKVKISKEVPLNKKYSLFVYWNSQINKFVVGVNVGTQMVGHRHAFSSEKIADATSFVIRLAQDRGLDLDLNPSDLQSKIVGVKNLAVSE